MKSKLFLPVATILLAVCCLTQSASADGTKGKAKPVVVAPLPLSPFIKALPTETAITPAMEKYYAAYSGQYTKAAAAEVMIAYPALTMTSTQTWESYLVLKGSDARANLIVIKADGIKATDVATATITWAPNEGLKLTATMQNGEHSTHVIIAPSAAGKVSQTTPAKAPPTSGS